ncbi:MAG: dTMP kinase [Chloroflexota bacterium]|nr:dTMP kinase [Chloroflexota bacterium]
MSLFITFEGGEGCGKSTQARALHRRLSTMGLPVVLTHEPGGTPLGARLRRLLKGDGEIDPLTELLLFNASRAHLVARVIAPALERGAVVVCDRFSHSTLAYQGYGRGLPAGLVQSANYVATQRLIPDLVVLLDMDVDAALARRGPRDRFEREGRDFHQRVRRGYLQMAQADPRRWHVVDASLPRREVQRVIWERVGPLLPISPVR